MRNLFLSLLAALILSTAVSAWAVRYCRNQPDSVPGRWWSRLASLCWRQAPTTDPGRSAPQVCLSPCQSEDCLPEPLVPMSPELQAALRGDLAELRFLSALGRTAEADAAPACPDGRQASFTEAAGGPPADEFTYPQEPQPEPQVRQPAALDDPEPIAVPPVPVGESIEPEAEELPMPKPLQSLWPPPVPISFAVLPAVLKSVAESGQEPRPGTAPRKAASASLQVELKLSPVPCADPTKDACTGCGVGHKQQPPLLRRVYPIAELLDAQEDHTPEHVIRILLRTVAPDSWEDHGGWGVVDFFPRGKCLIVCQTEEVHEEIASLLAELEAAVQGNLLPGSELRRTRFQEHAPAGQQSPLRASEAKPCPAPCHDR